MERRQILSFVEKNSFHSFLASLFIRATFPFILRNCYDCPLSIGSPFDFSNYYFYDSRVHSRSEISIVLCQCVSSETENGCVTFIRPSPRLCSVVLVRLIIIISLQVNGRRTARFRMKIFATPSRILTGDLFRRLHRYRGPDHVQNNSA